MVASAATFAGLGLLCTSAVLWQGLGDAARDVGSPRERRRLLLDYCVSWRAVALFSAWFILLSALLLSESRAGSLATGIALHSAVALRYLDGEERRF